MVKIGYTESDLDITEVSEIEFTGKRKVGTLKRKVQGKVYESPRIVFNRRYKRFIGRGFKTYVGRIVVRHRYELAAVPDWEQEGDCIVLFFPDNWKGKESVKDVGEVDGNR